VGGQWIKRRRVGGQCDRVCGSLRWLVVVVVVVVVVIFDVVS